MTLTTVMFSSVTYGFWVHYNIFVEERLEEKEEEEEKKKKKKID